jgi:copper resistance protein C
MSPAHRRALARLAAGSAMAGLLLLPTATAASAHDELVGSDPSPGAALDAAPAAVRLDFSADVLTFGAAIVVADDTDATWQSGEPVLDGASVSVPLDPALPDGSYQVRWRVVSSDGHPITGLVPFTVGDAAAESAEDTSAAAAADEEAPDPVAPDPVATDERTAVAAPSRAPGSGSTSRTLVVAGGGAVLALGIYALVVVVRGRRSAGASR